VDFEREAGLRRAVPAFGAARRLIREGARALEMIARDVVSDGLERASVVRARHAVGAVGPAVEQRPKVHPCDGAVLRYSSPHPHERRMAAAMAVKHLFARQGDLTGRPVMIASFATAISWLNGSLFPPK